MGNSPVLRAFYRKYLYSEKYAKYRKYALGGGKGAGCVRQHQAVQAGFVDDGMLLPAHGVVNRDPIILALVLRVNVSVKCVAGIGVPQRCCRSGPHLPVVVHTHPAVLSSPARGGCKVTLYLPGQRRDNTVREYLSFLRTST